jgi:hypothetical protein
MNGLRAFSGSSVTRMLSMTMPRSAFDASMASLTTDTTSLSVPISSAMLIVCA